MLMNLKLTQKLSGVMMTGIIFMLFMSVCVFGAYLKNVPLTLTQPDGKVINCFATGDEFYNRLHDANNYTIVRDPVTGYLVYAVKVGDELRASTYVVGEVDPAAVGLEQGVLDPPAVIEEAYRGFPEGSPSQVDLIKPAPTTGTINNLVVFIRFAGENEFTDPIAMYNTAFNDITPGVSSMLNYFDEVSYNVLTITTTFYPIPTTTVVSYQDAQPRGYYQPYNAVTNPIGYTGGDNGTMRRDREHTLLVNAVNYISASVPPGLNLDGDGDGRVDNVCFIVYGSPTGWASLLWPHMWSLYSQYVYINSKRVYTYNFQLQTVFGVSVLCHEMFHSLGAPDLYHYTSQPVTPVGIWDLMANNATPPQHMGAHMKWRYGTWIATVPTITTPGVYTLNPVTSPTGNCYKIPSPYSTTEYFVVEYRNKTSSNFESALPGSGLLVYRINSTQTGNAYGPPDEVYIYRPDGTTTINGNLNSAYFSSNVGRTAINDGTNPSSFLSDGSAGGLDISNVTSAGSTISFTYKSYGVDVALVIDRSGSMGAYGYMEPAKTAASTFVGFMQIGDNIAVASFREYAMVDFPLTTIESEATKTAAQNAIAAITSVATSKFFLIFWKFEIISNYHPLNSHVKG